MPDVDGRTLERAAGGRVDHGQVEGQSGARLPLGDVAPQARAGDANNPDNPDIEIVGVTAARGTAANIAPTKSSLDAFQPTSIMTRTFIEDSVADVSDYTAIALVSPSVSSGNDSNAQTAVCRACDSGWCGRYNRLPV